MDVLGVVTGYRYATRRYNKCRQCGYEWSNAVKRGDLRQLPHLITLQPAAGCPRCSAGQSVVPGLKRLRSRERGLEIIEGPVLQGGRSRDTRNASDRRSGA